MWHHWRGVIGGHKGELANDLVDRTMGDGLGVWGAGAEEMFLKENRLLALLKMARHKLVSDPDNGSFLSLVLSFEEKKAHLSLPRFHLTSRHFQLRASSQSQVTHITVLPGKVTLT